MKPRELLHCAAKNLYRKISNASNVISIFWRLETQCVNVICMTVLKNQLRSDIFLKIDNQFIPHTRITELISLIQFAFFSHAFHRYEISHFSFVTSISLLRGLIQIRISIKFTQIWIGYQRVKALILNPHFSRKRNKRMRKKP